MFKKLFRAFSKKKDEPVVEEIEVIEADEIIEPEPVVLMFPEIKVSEGTPLLEILTDDAVRDIAERIAKEGSITPTEEPVEIAEEQVDEIINEVNVESSFKYEVYVGDTEEDVKLVNTHDFQGLMEARIFGFRYARDNGKQVYFVHEEVEYGDGEKGFHRHY